MNIGKILVWIVMAYFAWLAVDGFFPSKGDPNTRNLVGALGKVQGTVFGLAAAGLGVALFLERRKGP